MHTTHSQPTARPALGLRIPRPERPAIAWLPWQVVDRDGCGFHVSREAVSGQHIPEALKNEVGRIKVFRRRELAQAAADAANGNVARNYVPGAAGLASAICQCCGKRSRPAKTEVDGEPSLWDMARGWSCAPFPAAHRHADGSVGSTYTCPACNSRLRKGETLRLRAYLPAAKHPATRLVS